MNNVEILLIRACKSLEPSKRLDSVYRRFYVRSTKCDWNWDNKATILIRLISKCYPILTEELVDGLNPNNALYYVKDENNYTYYEHLVGVLVSHIRLAPVSRFEGFKKPSKYKNMN